MAEPDPNITVGASDHHDTSLLDADGTLVLQQRRGSQRKADEPDADEFRLAPDVSLAEVLAVYAEAAERTDSVIAGIPARGQAVAVPRGLA
ncbi:hypothetical protein ABZ299_14500 [Streptomyces sp. NPDC006184]|uniref:hypothetical protein n=1 Tax=Streptomyces sp. NPDC006184 TaxID=3155455 RepID=UPI0033A383D9